MMKVILPPVFTLMLVFSITASHNLGGSKRVVYSRLPPWMGKYSYFKANPLFVGYPGIYVQPKARTEAPAVTIPTTIDSNDLYGCGTDYGPWWTPEYCRQYFLHWSATSGNITLMLSLLEEGRDINLQHNVERTALHIAAHWGRATMVSLLLNRGADPTLTDQWGYTALELAEFKKCDDEEYFKTWIRSCTRAENNYPKTISLLKAGCQMTGCSYPFHCVQKICIKP